MATGFDELLDFLLSEIALLGVQGMHDSLRVLSLLLQLHQPLFTKLTTFALDKLLLIFVPLNV